jgi:hypothetical protein
MSPTLLQKATPVLIVERIEPIIPFWEKLGATVTVQVPDGTAADGRLAFIILRHGPIELMYQTLASLREDLVGASTAKEAFRAEWQQSYLYLEVARLAEVERALAHERLIMPRRTTFYGSTELGYADPAGNVIVFAEPAAVPDTPATPE